MECFRCGSCTTFSVSFSDWRFRRRVAAAAPGLRGQLWRQQLGWRPAQVSCVAGGGGRKSCVATVAEEEAQKERFADEEDYIKAGGSELLFVQMQESKPMELQSKLANKVLRLLPVPTSTLLSSFLSDPFLVLLANSRDRILCQDSGVTYIDAKVEKIIEDDDGHSIVACEGNIMIPCRLATVASGAASGKLLQYEVGGPRVSVQTAYGLEAEVENNPYDPSLMVFMDYRDYVKDEDCLEAEYPTFLYVMPMSSTRVFYEEWSYIPVGGSLPNTEQRNLAFGAAASMVHPATGYSVVRSLSEAPNYASVIANILKKNNQFKDQLLVAGAQNPSMQGEEVKARVMYDDLRGIWSELTKMWQGFLGSTLSSVNLVWFAIFMFVLAPQNMRMRLVRHLLSDPTGATMARMYLSL
ncbi:hypothetical protein Taro_023141 [Colocasia esculenta]|uniref:Lycopene epsilon-cyclase n=1 Tax=Colocasia esculenta TaxID=4460 RepID=A0A843V3F7_COLES|nr:hypothetical protein [Colocasia esculenta]